MTETLRMAGFACAAALLSFTLRAAHRQAGAAAAMAAGLMLFFFALTSLGPAVETLKALSERAGIGQQTATLLLKLSAMAYVTEFAVQACRDAGEEGLAGKAALCGKMLLMAQTLPLIREIGEVTMSLIP
ncbi:MAG: hypothetical protein IK099_08280 [Clostridia bacterium]|nr:hypothetical protein [Clostridia bacterium]